MIHVRSSPGTHVRTFNEGLTSNHSNKNQLSMTHRLASMAMNWELKYIKIRAVCRPKKKTWLQETVITWGEESYQ